MYTSFTKQFVKTIEQSRIWCTTSKNISHKNNCDIAKGSTCKTYKIVMIRHGESDWNKKNLFCGWYDASLSSKGVEEAISAGKTLKQRCYEFDVAHTSVLKRAEDTLCNILNLVDPKNSCTVHKNWRLNERHYGSLTGLNKSETAKKYGEDKVKLWRRSFDIPPPPMEVDHPYYCHIKNDPRYVDGPSECEFPTHESLKMTIQRTLPYWDNVIVPQIKNGCRIIIAAHGNSLRGIIKHLDSE
ncbi:phosphoglycerate mutase 1-like [Acyrthosiphon pisum]|uniref:Phosphoglycerate mutase n=1 Tax=Acyrthosiphon pisum TaxID=7029 RepID=A0A8R2JUA2_ACYPI|nr:phosphoglycerate mutase 1-like [Acyrthosiphon pisum]